MGRDRHELNNHRNTCETVPRKSVYTKSHMVLQEQFDLGRKVREDFDEELTTDLRSKRQTGGEEVVPGRRTDGQGKVLSQEEASLIMVFPDTFKVPFF